MAQTSVKKLKPTRPVEKEGVAKAAFSKRKSNRAISSDHQIVRWEGVKMSESCTLARKRRVKARKV